MITDEEIAQLSENPELAFVEFERILRNRLHEKEEDAANEQFGNADPYRLEYFNKVLAAASVYGIDELKGWKVPRQQDDVQDAYRNFQSEVDHYTTQIRLRYGAQYRTDTVGLDVSSKSKIHHYIGQIREAIEGAELPENKRDALYNKLNRFALEVDKARTNLQSGMSVYISLCNGIGEGFKKLEPARKFIDSIAGLMGKVKDVEDAVRPSLPRYEERRQLESPKNLLPPPKSTGQDLDDEIPF